MSSTSASSPTGTTDPNNNFFSPGSSPPLILAFLAIGLFSAAMVAVFGWRRVHFGRATTPFMMMDPLGRQIDGPGGRRRRDFFVGDPPKLWDLWTERPKDGGLKENDLGVKGMDEKFGSEDARWDNVMPLAVTPIREDEVPDANDSATNNERHTSANIQTHTRMETSRTWSQIGAFGTYGRHLPIPAPRAQPPPRQRSPSSTTSTSRPTLQQRLQSLRRIYRRNSSLPTHSTPHDTEAQSNEEKKKSSTSDSSPSSSSSPQVSCMQVTVAIAMPSVQRKGKRATWTSVDSGYEEDERLEYAIGFTRVPCKSEATQGETG